MNCWRFIPTPSVKAICSRERKKESKRKNGRPLSPVGATIRSLKIGEEIIVKGKQEYHVRGAVCYAQRSLGVRLVCNRIEGGFKITRKRKARAA